MPCSTASPAEVAVRVVDVAQEVEVGHHRATAAARSVPLALSSSFSATAKWRALKRPVFGSTRASSWSCGTAERAVDQQQRRNREGDQPRVPAPEGRHSRRRASRATRSVERLGNEKSPDSRIEWPRARCSIGAISDVVDDHDRSGGGESGERVVDVATRAELEDPVEARVGRQDRQRPVADVERSGCTRRCDSSATPECAGSTPSARRAPAGATSQPGSGRRWWCDYDWFRGVRTDEQLRHRGDRSQDDERRPSLGCRASDAQGAGRRDRRREGNDEEVHAAALVASFGEPGPTPVSTSWRIGLGTALIPRPSPGCLRLGSTLLIARFLSYLPHRRGPHEHRSLLRGEASRNPCTTLGSYVPRAGVRSPFFGTPRISPKRGRGRDTLPAPPAASTDSLGR